MRTCKKCGVEKALNEFFDDPKRAKFKCKECVRASERAKDRRSYERHADQRRASARAYKAAHPDRVAASRHASYLKHRDKRVRESVEYARRNREKVRARTREWLRRNADRVNRQRRERYATDPKEHARIVEQNRKSHIRHRDARLAAQKRWRQSLADERLVRHRHAGAQAVRRWNRAHYWWLREYVWDFRAKTRSAPGVFTADEFITLCESYGNRCLRCGSGDPLTADHVMPLSRGGANDISNIQPLCMPCNSAKGNRETDYRGRFEENSGGT